MRWLLLTHHLPPEPAYLRVKVRRRLERLGAVALKNSVYALPAGEDALEDFQWLLQEIVREGGEATLAEATFVDGITEGRLIARSREARDADYEELVRSARALRRPARSRKDGPERASPTRVGAAKRLNKRLEEVVAMDYFEAEGRRAAEQAVAETHRATEAAESHGTDAAADTRSMPRGRTWVTRTGVKVDRIASAWLIRRFIDPDARFVFVAPEGYVPVAGELRFDMFEGEFTHVGDGCTFETLLAHFDLGEPGLDALAEIVHDIDCKDEKFRKVETAGVASLVDGIVRSEEDDVARVERGSALFDALLAHFRAPA